MMYDLRKVMEAETINFKENLNNNNKINIPLLLARVSFRTDNSFYSNSFPNLY